MRVKYPQVIYSKVNITTSQHLVSFWSALLNNEILCLCCELYLLKDKIILIKDHTSLSTLYLNVMGKPNTEDK